MKVRIQVEDKIITRKPKLVQFGNFQMAVVRYMNNDYLLDLKQWSGDEYLRGQETDLYSLGRKL